MELPPATMIALLFGLCALCQWVAWKTHIPAIVYLLSCGICLGPVATILNPDQLLGELLFPFVSLAVAIILFEGSLTLVFREIKDMHGVVRNIIFCGCIISWIITTIGCYLLFKPPFEIALLFGAIMVVTGPTVIAPLLHTVRPTSSIANILRWESIIIDPVGASLAVLVYEFIVSGGGESALGHTLLSFATILIVGGCTGCAAGYILGQLLRRNLIPESLQSLVTIAMVLCSFTLANTLQHEAGLVTVTICGLWLANMRGVQLQRILEFKETLSTLLISLLFIILAARINFSDFKDLGWRLFALFAIIQLLARPISIHLSSIGSALQRQERHFLAWVAPRGIVAAAVASLFALRLDQQNYPKAELLVPLVFAMIIGTVLLQSFTARPLARKLRVSQPTPDGIFIVGTNLLSLKLASTLQKCGIRVLVAGQAKSTINRLKAQGVATFFGNPCSEQAEYYLDLSLYQSLLALSQTENVNTAATLRFQGEFSQQHIHSLPEEEHRQRAAHLFPPESCYAALMEKIAAGAEFHCHQLPAKTEPGELPLFIINSDNSLQPAQSPSSRARLLVTLH